MRRVLLGFVFSLGLMFVSVHAHAMPISHLSWDSISGGDLEFDALTMPVPVPEASSISFRLDDLSVLENGAGPDTTNTFRFFTVAGSGGFTVSGLSTFTSAFGGPVWSGTLAAPTFVDGVYVMSVGTLTITSSDSNPIPEPSAALVFALGLALVCRRTRGRVAA
jgi:hypothetical protein